MANYDINYDDPRFQKVESEKTAALNEIDKTYGDMISQSDKYYQDQIQASKDWADKQTQLQQEKTDFAIEKIEQNKAQAKKDYTKEQSGAYVDWQKQSNEYGANAEKQASVGMSNTGYSESSQVSMYSTYQNRVATARESYSLAVQNYNNSITEARLQNNSILAEIAFEALQKQLELSLQGFQYKNTLILEKANKRTEVENNYYNRYQDVLNQINTENALAEEIRQYNEQMAFEREQFEYQKAKAGGGSGSGGGRGSGGGSAGGGGSTTINKGNGNGDSIDKADAGLMKNIINLGYGPISANELARLVDSGQVQETENGFVNVVQAPKLDNGNKKPYSGAPASPSLNKKDTTTQKNKLKAATKDKQEPKGNAKDFWDKFGLRF